ncbi:toxin-activating lysine-acyltransferase [Erwinia sp. E602]|uniref:toxin-activating lysine-acyltransferase n=1 Tax=unclassified Erwinia TaxID=2622719 RepID=UPI0007020656|nr:MULTISPECIES: toxin-activating lysine-acyltransferase [unclassified Erwinia]KQN58021.1 RTX toxin [Erwinia sp. Leaf53]QUG77231.1 toxin-activating lysine-acyltransferase [Erwinia sp. E602]
MRVPVNELRVICPLLGGNFSEAEVLGASSWLWMHSERHRHIPLSALPTLLLPAIKHRQFALALRDEQPLFFLSWAWKDEEAEHRYLTQSGIHVQERDWHSGDRLWFRDWIAPFGEMFALRRLVGGTLFPHLCARALDHKGDQRGLRVNHFRGDAVSHQDFDRWQRETPLASR